MIPLAERLHKHDLPYHSVAPGAILIEWNIHEPAGQQGAAGLWDTHIRYAFAIKSMNTTYHKNLQAGRRYVTPLLCKA